MSPYVCWLNGELDVVGWKNCEGVGRAEEATLIDEMGEELAVLEVDGDEVFRSESVVFSLEELDEVEDEDDQASKPLVAEVVLEADEEAEGSAVTWLLVLDWMPVLVARGLRSLEKNG